jgi:GEVED domain/Secretion system C-terminal sorting domain/Domain of unknown function DUF11
MDSWNSLQPTNSLTEKSFGKVGTPWPRMVALLIAMLAGSFTDQVALAQFIPASPQFREGSMVIPGTFTMTTETSISATLNFFVPVTNDGQASTVTINGASVNLINGPGTITGTAPSAGLVLGEGSSANIEVTLTSPGASPTAGLVFINWTSEQEFCFVPGVCFLVPGTQQVSTLSISGVFGTPPPPPGGDLDFGDAPDNLSGAPDYPTLLASNGARHQLPSESIFIGSIPPDIDPDGQPVVPADGDDSDGTDDEDGAVFLSGLISDSAAPTTSTVSVTTVGSGMLSLWIDFGIDGSWTGSDLVYQAATGPGTTSIPITVPAGAAIGTSYARVRYCSSADCLTPTGLAADGEVEDYAIEILDSATMPTVSLDIPDAGIEGPFSIILDGGDLLLLDKDGNVVSSSPVASVGSIEIMGTAGNDSLIVDFSGGNPIPSGGLTYDGQNQSGGPGDTITIVGGTFDSITETFENESDGSIEVVSGGTTSTITYVNLEPVIDLLFATDRTFVFTGGAESITLSDDGTPSDTKSLIDSSLGESVVFINPTGTLTVRAGTGDDTVTFTSLDDGITPSTIIIEGNSGDDVFNITPTSTYGMIVDGGSPSTCRGDILHLDLSGVTGAAQTVVSPIAGNWSFDAPTLAVNFTGMEVRVDAVTDIDVSAAWNHPDGYPADEREVIFTLTNLGIDEATCIRAEIVLPAILNLISPPTEDYPAASSGSFAGATWEVERILSGDTAALTFRGVIDALMQETVSASIDSSDPSDVLSADPDLDNNTASAAFDVLGIFRFPANAEAISAAYMELPSGLERLVVGLFQGAPGFTTAVLCRIPDPDGVFFTQPGVGDHWRPCGTGLPYPLHVTDLMVDDRQTPGDVTDDRLWLASWGSAGLYYSEDYGETFTAAEPELGAGGNAAWKNVYTITRDAGSILYISANNGLVYRSLNEGDSWQRISSLPGASADTPWSMEAHPTEAGTLYAGTFGRGVYVTTDFGFTWETLGGDAINDDLQDLDASGDDFAGHVFDMAFSPDGDGYLFIGTGRGVWRIPLDAVGGPTGAWSQMDVTVTLDNGTMVTPEIRVLTFMVDSGDGDEDLLIGSWGLGALISETPLGDGPFAPLALREGQVSMILAKPDGTVLVGTQEFGVQPLQPAAVSSDAESEAEQVIPRGYVLEQNYPNPFNPATTIHFALPEMGKVRLAIYDALGREVSVLVDRLLTAGQHRVQFSAGNLPSGTYLYRMSTDAGTMSRTLLLMK